MTPHAPASRRYLRWLGIGAVAALVVRLCWPDDNEGARASVTAAIAAELRTEAGLVELEWFDTREDGKGFTFEAVARVSSSQPGDLHADRYQVHGTGRTAPGRDAFDVVELRVAQLPRAPPEPRP